MKNPRPPKVSVLPPGPPQPPAKKEHEYDLLQSVTVIRLMRNRTTEEIATIIRVWRDQKKLQPNFQIDDQDLRDAIADVDPFYRDQILKRLIDLPRVRRVEVTDHEGCGIIAEN